MEVRRAIMKCLRNAGLVFKQWSRSNKLAPEPPARTIRMKLDPRGFTALEFTGKGVPTKWKLSKRSKGWRCMFCRRVHRRTPRRCALRLSRLLDRIFLARTK